MKKGKNNFYKSSGKKQTQAGTGQDGNRLSNMMVPQKRQGLCPPCQQRPLKETGATTLRSERQQEASRPALAGRIQGRDGSRSRPTISHEGMRHRMKVESDLGPRSHIAGNQSKCSCQLVEGIRAGHGERE